MNELIELNIKNLSLLWQTAGIPFKGFYTDNELSYSRVLDSRWPNRIWLKQGLNKSLLDKVKGIMKTSSILLSFSYWTDFENSNLQLIGACGFMKKSEQIGMSLILKDKFASKGNVQLKLITERNQAMVWAMIYPKSFGYQIGEEILMKTKEDIQYYLICVEEQPIGTAIAFQAGNGIGIHGLGVIPEMRKKGFADEVMASLLNQAIDSGLTYAFLQASVMGESIYRKIGFKRDFLQCNFL